MRRTTAIMTAVAAAALVAGVLAGCAPAPRGPGNQPGGCTPALPTGDASSIVKASGKVGTEPNATFPTPIVARDPQATVVKAGRGAPTAKGGQVDFAFTVYNGKTGRAIGGGGYNGQANRLAAGSPIPQQPADGSRKNAKAAISEALVCAQPGSRIAVTSTARQLGLGSLEQYGIKDSGTVVTLIDVEATYLGKADGMNQLPQDGMPNVITAVDGQPGIVLQELDKPRTARSEVVKAGGGAVLKKGQKAVLHYTAWTWPDGNGGKPVVIDSLDTWSSGIAQDVTLSKSNGVLPAKAIDDLIGRKVGSQLLVVLPPKDGFGANPPQGAAATDTVIFVIDILGVRS